MSKTGRREFHLRENEILQFLMADNSEGEDELHLDEEDQHFIEEDMEIPAEVVEIESADQNIDEHTSLDICGTPSVEGKPTFRWSKNSYLPHVYHESNYEFGRVNVFSGRNDTLTPMEIFLEVTKLDILITEIIIPESITWR